MGGRDKRRERGRDEGKGCIQMIILSNHCGVVCRSKCARIYNDTEETSPYRLTGEKRERERETVGREG